MKKSTIKKITKRERGPPTFAHCEQKLDIKIKNKTER